MKTKINAFTFNLRRYFKSNMGFSLTNRIATQPKSQADIPRLRRNLERGTEPKPRGPCHHTSPPSGLLLIKRLLIWSSELTIRNPVL